MKSNNAKLIVPQMPNEGELAAMRRAGYKVEDMGAEYGDSFKGEFRWLNIQTGDFQDHRTSDSEAEAWCLARSEWLARCMEPTA